MSTSKWFVSPKTNRQAGFRLFCFPYAGGSASIYRLWGERTANLEVCAVELPGRGLRLSEQLYTGMEPLTEAMLKAIEPMLDKPFAFFGHSMGALIAFEVARLLKRTCLRQPTQLFLSGHGAPHIRSDKKPVHLLEEKEFVERLKTLNGTPLEVLQNEELMEFVGPIIRADFAITETYSFRAGEVLDCPITVFNGVHDADVSFYDLAQWRSYTYGAFQTSLFPGDHFYLHGHYDKLCRLIEQQLLVQCLEPVS